MEDVMIPWIQREPSLADMMRDPIFRAVMTRDQVAEADFRRLIETVRSRLDVSPSVRTSGSAD
jgi:hypothetical protein